MRTSLNNVSYDNAVHNLKMNIICLTKDKDLPPLNEERKTFARNKAMHAFLHREAMEPEFPSLLMRCSPETLMAMNDREDAKARIYETVRVYLMFYEREWSINTAIFREAERFLKEWEADPQAEAHMFRALKDAVEPYMGFVILDCKMDDGSVHGYVASAADFGNQCEDGYDKIRFFFEEGATMESGSKNGTVRKDSIIRIRSYYNGFAIWTAAGNKNACAS